MCFLNKLQSARQGGEIYRVKQSKKKNKKLKGHQSIIMHGLYLDPDSNK